MSEPIHEQLARLDREVVAKIKGMLARGDAVDDIAVWFGLNTRVVDAVVAGSTHALIPQAPRSALPPPGPYHGAGMGYRALDEVRAAERRLHAVSTAVRRRYKQS